MGNCYTSTFVCMHVYIWGPVWCTSAHIVYMWKCDYIYILYCSIAMHHAGSMFEEYQVTVDFTATSEEQLTVKVGDTVSVLSKDSSGECNSVYMKYAFQVPYYFTINRWLTCHICSHDSCLLSCIHIPCTYVPSYRLVVCVQGCKTNRLGAQKLPPEAHRRHRGLHWWPWVRGVEKQCTCSQEAQLCKHCRLWDCWPQPALLWGRSRGDGPW